MSEGAGGTTRARPLLELTRARMLEFLREPEAVFWVFVFPVLLAVVLGIAFRQKPMDRARVALLDRKDRTSEIAAALARDARLDLRVLDADAGELALRKGRVDVLVELAPPVKSGDRVDAAQADRTDGALPRDAEVVYRFDATRPEGRVARLLVDDALQRSLGRADVVASSDKPVVEVGARYIDFLIPGLIGLNLMGSGMWGLGFSVVVARTRKLLKRYAATPMRRSDYLLSYGLSRLLFLALEVAAVMGAGRLLFGVRLHGAVVHLALIALLGAACFAGIGLLAAARPRTIEAVSGLMNLIQLPMWLLSGTFFSYERFPEITQPMIRALPLTALNDALRAVVNDGLGLAATWPQIALLLVWGVVSFVVAVRIFRWQ